MKKCLRLVSLILFISLFYNFPKLIGQSIYNHQHYYDDEASRLVTSATYVKVTDNMALPSFIRFSEDNTIDPKKFFEWIRKNSVYNIPLEFEMKLNRIDRINLNHRDYVQTINGVPIENTNYHVKTRNNKVVSANGYVYFPSAMNTNPTISEKNALNSALQIIGPKEYIWESSLHENYIKSVTKNAKATYYPEGELVFVNNNGQLVLTWKFEIRDARTTIDQIIYIDADSGDKVKSKSLILECDPGTVASTWHGTQPLNTDEDPMNNYILFDDCDSPNTIRSVAEAGLADYNDADNNWVENGVRAPATSLLYARVSVDYFDIIHSRDIISDAGGAISVRHRANTANAFSAGGGVIIMGDGNDGGQDDEFYNTLDVIGHELTHDVISQSSNLTYQGESGALNESFADIFGETIELWYENDILMLGGVPDWLHREDYYNGANRSFINPNDNGDPDTYMGTNWAPTGIGDPDAGGVHTNSGVQNFWFYLLVNGGSGTNDNGDLYSVTGIGVEDARSIAFQNMIFELGPSSDFSDAREGAIQAAIDLFGECSFQHNQVVLAWSAVGVGTSNFEDLNIICPAPQIFNLNASCDSPIATYPDYRGLLIIADEDCILEDYEIRQDPLAGSTLLGNPGDVLDILLYVYNPVTDDTLSSCLTNITLQDSQDPNLFCPPNQEFVLDANCMGMLPDYTPDVFLIENCDVTLTQTPPPGTLLTVNVPVNVTITAEDDTGNMGMCSFMVTPVDETPPVISLPAMSDTVDCDGMGNNAELMAWLASNGGAMATESCPGGVTWSNEILYIDDMCGNTQSTFYRFYAEDASGNISITNAFFVIQDTMPPTITGGMDTTFMCDQNGAGNDNALSVWLATNAGAMATDECSMVTWTNNFGLVAPEEDCGNLQTYTVTFYATDECGNVDSVMFDFELIDTIPPAFLNCPREDIIENIESGLCDAFVNFAPVIAGDNCSESTVRNISSINPATGSPWKSGDRFPIGITTLYFEASDACGNADTCSLKVIVNDVDTYPDIDCPLPILDENDLWECGGTVNLPLPEVTDVCPDLLITTYQIIHKGDTIATGLNGPPAEFLFPIGESTIEYCVQDHPLLLITEVSQDIDTCGGMSMPPMGAVASDDYLEITNFGPIVYNVSCMLIRREFAGQIDTFIVPDSTFLIPGEVLVLQYGEVAADDNDPDDLLFYKGDAPNLLANDQALYTLSYDMNIIDQITMFANAEGGIKRKRIKDNNVPTDFILADECDTLTLGMYNPDYPAAFDNTGNTAMYDTVAIQSIPKHTDECSTTVTIEDTENPFCAMRVDTNAYTTGPLVAVVDSCNELFINVPSMDSCIVEYVGIMATNMTALGNVILTISSPEGTDTTLTNWNGDSLEIQAFYGDKSPGDWRFHFEVLDKTTFAGFSVDDISLSITCLDTFMMSDTMFLTTAPTMPDAVGTCDTVFTWVHPLFLDKCKAGTIEVRYESDDIDPANLPDNGGPTLLDGFGGQVETEVFYEGTTTVKYILRDTAGNVDSCSFDVIVKDLELPLLVSCPPDTTIQLAGGECRVVYEYNPEFIDNCGIDTIYGIPPSGSEFEIGITQVKVYAVDINGNIDSTSCSFEVEVLEYLPDSIDMACNELVHISLGGDCEAVITADMILKGNEYRCFENYCMEITDEKGHVVFSGLLSEVQYTFTEEDQNKEFTVSIIDCLGTDDILNNEPINSCWGKILVQEKLTPDIECTPDLVLTCNDNTDPAYTGGGPDILSCEVDVTVYHWDDVESLDECGNPAAIITRTWYVEDGEGNRSSCEQKITILPGMPDQINWPKDLDFNDPFICPTKGDDVPPSVTGVPMINGKPLNESYYCNYFVNYSDEVYYGACEGDFDIVRTWKVKSSCLDIGEDNPLVHYQVIRIRDNQEPIVTGCPENLTVGVDPWTCEANLNLPLPKSVTDVCNDVEVHAKIYGGGKIIQTGSLAGGNLVLRAEKLRIGEYKVVYDFIDVCGNKASCEYYLTVIDDVKPNAIAKEYTVASVSEIDEEGNHIVKVNAESINNGSWDACSDLQYYVRRMDGDPHDCDDKDFFPYGYDDKLTRAEAIAMYYDEVECRTIESLDDFALMSVMNPGIGDGYDYGPEICNLGEIQYNGDEWGEYVKFCCDDFGTGEDADGDGYANEYRVELIAFDHYGNWNVTWGWVKIEDPNPPTLVAKPYHAYCHEEVLNGPISAAIESIAADAFDTTLVYAYGICDTKYEVIQGTPYDVWYDPTCKYGSFKIPYETRGSKGSLVRNVQTVYIYYKDDFSCDDIYGWTLDEEDEWYDDADNYDFRDNLSAECEPEVPPTLVWDAGPCELIGYTLVTDTLYFETDACRKIVNEWTVIDWCVYDAVEDYDKRDFLQAHWYEYQQIAAYWDDKGIDRSDTRRNRRDDELYCNSSEYWYNIGDIHNPDYEPTRTTYEAYAVDGKYLDFEYEIEVPNWKEGIYKWTQLIKVSDDDAPVITPFAGDVKMDTILTECGLDLTLELCATDDGDCPADWLKWELWEIDEIGGDIISESYGLKAALCAVWTNIPGTEESKVTRYYRAKAWDGCGNVDIYDFTWKIEDGKAPTPYCINLSSALMQDPDGTGELVSMVELWACDFDLGSYDNCPENELYFTFDGVAPTFGKVGTYDDIEKYEQYYTENGVLMFNVSGTWKNSAGSNMSSSGIAAVKLAYTTGDDEAYDGEVYRWLPVGHADNTCGLPTGGKVFTEDEMANGDTDGDGNVDVQMDVWDECFNVDNCSVELTLRCSDCDDATPMANVAGAIYTADQRMVSDVAVNIQSINNMVGSKSMYTKEDGQYAFTNNPMYLDYYVVARKEGDDDQGVSTLDLILIKRHILGLQILEDPYLRIAADVNYDKKISATDLIQIRKLILGIYPAFPDNESWRFVDSDQELNLETVLSEFKERRDIPDLSGNQMSENLIAVKIGDIDGDARVNAREGQLITRNNNRLTLGFTDRYVRKGEMVSVTFEGIEPVEVYGMQGTFTFTGAKLSGIRGMGFNLNASNYSIFENSASVSFNNDEAVAFDGALFEMELIAQESGLISEMISIDGSIASNEIYVGNDLNVYVLELEKEEEGLSYALKQNEPNPFSDITTIGFNLARSGNATIVIHDVAGKIVKRISNNYPKGYNEVRLNKQELNVSGVLYYTLSSGDFTATKRMIVI